MFPDSWYAAGVVTAEIAADFAEYARRDPAKGDRHWRWLAFRDFLEERTPLDADCCAKLFELGMREPDLNLGTAIMCAVLHQRWCPVEVKQRAASERLAVRRAARIRWSASSGE